jgi:probable HAF family extracellular repeat protein
LLNSLGGGAYGVANAINNQVINVIVGGSGASVGFTGGEHATAWEWSSLGANPNPQAVDLNGRISSLTPLNGMTLVQALDVNDLGQIVGFGVDGSGIEHAFLLTPVPEPSTLALCGLGALALRKWRRRKPI